jgi:hypothetical protein
MQLPDSTASITLEDPNRHFTATSARPPNPRQWVMHAQLLLVFDHPDIELLEGLKKPHSERGAKVAKRIHENYLKCLDVLVTYCRLELNTNSIIDSHRSSLGEILETDFGMSVNMSWSSDGHSFIPFTHKSRPRRKINPVFASKALIKPHDWSRLEKAIARGDAPPVEVEELLKLRTKVFWGEKRVAIVESMAIMEMILKREVNSALLKKGVSQTRQNSLKETAGLSIFLNFMLPLCLAQSTFRRLAPAIQSIDRLRKIRNQIMHENLSEEHIEQAGAYDGIDPCIKLSIFLQKAKKN